MPAITRAQQQQLEREEKEGKDIPIEEVPSEQDFANNYLCASTPEHQEGAAAAPGVSPSVSPIRTSGHSDLHSPTHSLLEDSLPSHITLLDSTLHYSDFHFTDPVNTDIDQHLVGGNLLAALNMSGQEQTGANHTTISKAADTSLANSPGYIQPGQGDHNIQLALANQENDKLNEEIRDADAA